MFKSGFVNIIGLPNAGKSSLINRFMQDNFSIVTSKAQTTRHRALGIVNGNNYQLVISLAKLGPLRTPILLLMMCPKY